MTAKRECDKTFEERYKEWEKNFPCNGCTEKTPDCSMDCIDLISWANSEPSEEDEYDIYGDKL